MCGRIEFDARTNTAFGTVQSAAGLRLARVAARFRRASAELRTANEQLKSLDRLKDDFMSSVTHELRTPLTSIRALAEVMVDDVFADRFLPVPGVPSRDLPAGILVAGPAFGFVTARFDEPVCLDGIDHAPRNGQVAHRPLSSCTERPVCQEARVLG